MTTQPDGMNIKTFYYPNVPGSYFNAFGEFINKLY